MPKEAYSYPAATGKGKVGGIIELGGGFGEADLTAYFGGLGIPVPVVTAKLVDGGTNTSDGPTGADGEVLLDIEIAGSLAPEASFNVYFAPNTDAGFVAAIKAAVADEVQRYLYLMGWSRRRLESVNHQADGSGSCFC